MEHGLKCHISPLVKYRQNKKQKQYLYVQQFTSNKVLVWTFLENHDKTNNLQKR